MHELSGESTGMWQATEAHARRIDGGFLRGSSQGAPFNLSGLLRAEQAHHEDLRALFMDLTVVIHDHFLHPTSPWASFNSILLKGEWNFTLLYSNGEKGLTPGWRYHKQESKLLYK